MSNEIDIIQRVRFVDKWAEIWFENGASLPDNSDRCCKVYMLWEALDNSGISRNEIMSNGFKGLGVEWGGIEWEGRILNDRPKRLFLPIAVQAPYLMNLSEPLPKTETP